MRFTFIVILLHSFISIAQPNEKQMGAWYMLFYDWNPDSSDFGIQGDYQYRNWNLGGDLEQLLLRTGITYRPYLSPFKFTLGYAHISTGAFGRSNKSKTFEHRVYQEVSFNNRVEERIYLTHRYRYEQRFIPDQNFRSRFRYNLFCNIALNKKEMLKATFYLALYNEIFINGERNIGNGKSVELFDRNRTYGALGYCATNYMKFQLGAMHQITNNWKKTQMQFSCHWQF